MCKGYKTSILWNKFTIRVSKESFTEVNAPTHPGQWLLYYRNKLNLSRKDLINAIGINPKQLSKIELLELYPNKELSIKLAAYFKLKTKYFHDDYYEVVDSLNLKVISYRKKKGLTLKQIENTLGILAVTWRSWENGRSIKRSSYGNLKDMKII